MFQYFIFDTKKAVFYAQILCFLLQRIVLKIAVSIETKRIRA